MQADSVSRVLLGFIAICMLLLLAQGTGMFGGGGATAPVASATSGAGGRYIVMVQPTRGGALLVKTDTATGKVWRKALIGDGPWVFVDEESRPPSDP